MKLGVMILPDRRWRDGAERWRAVEALGFDAAWTYDHIWWRALGDGAWFSSLPVLAAAGAVTSRIDLGVMVASPNFRHPVLLAKDAIAIDDISRGRFVLGLGAGSPDAGDAAVVDRRPLSPRERSERFAEFVTLTDRLLRSPTTNHTGRFYEANDARMLPGCVRRPRVPLAVAATGPRGMALAARHADAWVTLGPVDFSRDWKAAECREVVARQVARLRAACADAGRDADDLERVFVTTGWVGDPLASAAACLEIARCYADAGITHLVIHWPREREPYAGDPRVLERIATEALPEIHRL